MRKPAMDFSRTTISSAFDTIVPMASARGTTKTSSRITVIAATASALRCHRRAWSQSMAGHVATTIIVAHIAAARNGRRIQSEATISAPRKIAPRSVRVSSR